MLRTSGKGEEDRGPAPVGLGFGLAAAGSGPSPAGREVVSAPTVEPSTESTATVLRGTVASTIAVWIATSTPACHLRAWTTVPLLAAHASASSDAMRASSAAKLTSEVAF